MLFCKFKMLWCLSLRTECNFCLSPFDPCGLFAYIVITKSTYSVHFMGTNWWKKISGGTTVWSPAPPPHPPQCRMYDTRDRCPRAPSRWMAGQGGGVGITLHPSTFSNPLLFSKRYVNMELEMDLLTTAVCGGASLRPHRGSASHDLVLWRRSNTDW